MSDSNIVNLVSFIQMVYGGLAIGFCYDLVDFVFYAIAKKRHLSDIVFWVCTLMIASTVFFYAADLSLRLFLLTGLIAGWGLYFLAISPFIQWIFERIGIFFEVSANAVAKPVKKAYRWGRKKYEREILAVKRGAKNIINLPNSIKKVYNKYSKYFIGKRRQEHEQAKQEETR